MIGVGLSGRRVLVWWREIASGDEVATDLRRAPRILGPAPQGPTPSECSGTFSEQWEHDEIE